MIDVKSLLGSLSLRVNGRLTISISPLCVPVLLFLPAGTFICLAYYFLEVLDNSNCNSSQSASATERESKVKPVEFKCDHNLSLQTWPEKWLTVVGQQESASLTEMFYIHEKEVRASAGLVTDCVFEGVSVSEGRIIPQFLSNFSQFRP